MWTYKGVKVHWLGHDSFVLQGSKTVVLDPFKAKGNFKGDVLLISHEHQDHLSPDDVTRFSGPSTILVAPRQCEGPLRPFKQAKKIVEPWQSLDVNGVKIETIPAYNLNKFREPGKMFHPKEDKKVGYVVTLDGVRFYHAGDCDGIEEMKSLDADVAFLPVSGTYVMTPEEAAAAAEGMKAKVVVPMHIGKIIGTMADAERFKDLVGGSREVEILQVE
jgi:L-ascorbate metabolism protein UlaG (beta-lactamase superfamily)